MGTVCSKADSNLNVPKKTEAKIYE